MIIKQNGINGSENEIMRATFDWENEEATRHRPCRSTTVILPADLNMQLKMQLDPKINSRQ